MIGGCLQFIEGDPHSESECRQHGAGRSVMWMLTETQEHPIRGQGWVALTNEECWQGEMYHILRWGECTVYRERRGTKGLYSTLYCTLNITAPTLRWQYVLSSQLKVEKVPKTPIKKTNLKPKRSYNTIKFYYGEGSVGGRHYGAGTLQTAQRAQPRPGQLGSAHSVSGSCSH